MEPPAFPPLEREPEPPQTEPQTASSSFTCPECGRTFTTAQGLGSHRARSHDVAGSSKEAQRRKTKQTKQRAPAPSTNGERSLEALDVALLKALYPDGSMPVRAIAGVRAWLDEAHRLTR